VEIIEDFADYGRSGLTSEGRPSFTDMMENWVKKRNDFQYILCVDVSVWASDGEEARLARKPNSEDG
jgi:hypothetical protein